MPSVVSVVLVPCDDNEPIEQHAFNPLDYCCSSSSSSSSISHDGQQSHEVVGAKLLVRLIRERREKKNKPQHPHDPDGVARPASSDDAIISILEQCKTILLIRPSEMYGAGLYATCCCSRSSSSSNSSMPTTVATPPMPNIRATRLAMACGQYALRFKGDVMLFRAAPAHRIDSMYTDLTCDDINIGCNVTCDLRSAIIDELLVAAPHSDNKTSAIMIPEWLTDASRRNYHDAAVLARIAAVMTEKKSSPKYKAGDCGRHGGGDDVGVETDEEEEQHDDDNDDHESNDYVAQNTTFVAKTPLCLHCRRPASSLCPDCAGAYCCDRPRDCLREGWSHQCLCSTWHLYTRHRAALSTFPFLGDWVRALVARPCQLSDQPYQDYLLNTLGIDPTHDASSWWRIEVLTSGWNGGDSPGANTIDISNRISYVDGFYPLDSALIPPERCVDPSIATAESAKNALGFRQLRSWQDYYTQRNIPPDSPVALLLTFPLTMYYAFVEYGEVPCTVARMMNRRVRIHVVGVEKELSCLDLFKEVVFLLPEECAIEIVFVIRPDMLPASLRADDKKSDVTIDLMPNLRVVLAKGTYADSLDPNFDCGSGPPDMVLAFNAGLFAYPSWRSVVEFLDRSHQVVGFLTDYNEFSASQCASLGGGRARETVRVNPFRQPRAMPVLSMNLPQFCNGFSYVFNEQHLES